MSLHLASASTPACLLEEGGDKGIGFAVAFRRAVYAYEDLQPFSAGTDEHRQRGAQRPEGEDQCRQVLHMVEIQSDDLAVRFDRTRLMSALEYPRRGEPRQSALQLPASSARPSASAVR